ncbi:MAG: hypothetical protein COZ06_10800 [Armatimonadetes bacterium CG_4_10_14_3_um_filter_66_18]|nr:4Fe-4S dicluster domain-containing protein [Armatimonadota bacterium]PIY50173.1 MAG: hypothetical protein COZ06_10800 [Armatimonadetes bacterium CG_4_10_14_3_um_filter_66_18]PJB73158.1 MAG: hypothetical protein CO096_06380 [Armatimonadetes bacterium CG_4_9_14_3_um_filter_66_14]NCO92089.1 4Fe-4S dicluster domain-containing protein [Armatimonadota bacterium]NCP32421.1 4Fe-4S dicluster domain-containing protein [Armatimonadota bacterium]
MLYRKVGDTGIDVSALGFGTMRFKGAENAAEIIARGLQLGMNYFDIGTAYSFNTSDDNAEAWTGAALRGVPRERLVLSAKAQCRGEGEPKVERGLGIATRDQMWQCLENSLKRVGVDWFDFYQLWDMSAPAHFAATCEGADTPLQALREAKEQGLIKHLGFTTHAKSAETVEWLRRVPDFRTVTIYYNFADLACEEVIDYAQANGIGVNIMGPLRGGLLVGESAAFARHLPELAGVPVQEIALRFLLSYPGVSSVLSGMNEIAHLEQNAAVAADEQTMTSAQRHAFLAAFTELTGGEPLCTGCKYCQGVCPEGLPVFWMMGLFQLHEVFHLASASQQLAGLHGKARADAGKCTACQTCVEACPQDLPIPERMKRMKQAVEELHAAAEE